MIMPVKRIFVFLAMVVLLGAFVFAADMTGTWNATATIGSRSGNPTFVLKQAGEKLTGTYSGSFGTHDVNGTLKGNDVVMQFVAYGATIVYTGKLDKDGNKMEGSISYGGGRASGTFTATRKK
jgi:hypothetical protein